MVLIFVILVGLWVVHMTEQTLHPLVSLKYRYTALEKVLRRRSAIRQTVTYLCRCIQRQPELFAELAQKGDVVDLGPYQWNGYAVTYPVRITYISDDQYEALIVGNGGTPIGRADIIIDRGTQSAGKQDILVQGCHVHIDLL
jgi:hypothetical protein